MPDRRPNQQKVLVNITKKPNFGGPKKAPKPVPEKEPDEPRVPKERRSFAPLARAVAGLLIVLIISSVFIIKARPHLSFMSKTTKLTDFQCDVLLGKFRMADSAAQVLAMSSKQATMPPHLQEYAEEASGKCGGYASRMGDFQLDLYKRARYVNFLSQH